ncbi:MAG: hypothetical protein HZB19_21400 [Chloroflexi bacterium]|nr:hypothetical protein [Chloroflexota bacterium]
MTTQIHLPDNLQACFWDYPFTELSWQTDRDLIIRRILSVGNWESITWLRGQMEDKTLRKWIVSHKGRGLSPRQLRFWALILDLPGKTVDAWVEAAKKNPWGQK